jgi:hypothetical protein
LPATVLPATKMVDFLIKSRREPVLDGVSFVIE